MYLKVTCHLCVIYTYYLFFIIYDVASVWS